jgi:hypothetical protein
MSLGYQLVIKPIVITGLDKELALYHSVDDALTAGSP